jgi:hypothetical protein
MKAIALRILITAGVASIFIWFYWSNKQSVGYFAETHDGVTSIQAGTTPSNIAISVLGLALFCVLMQIKIQVEDFHVAPLWRRLAAFLIDFLGYRTSHRSFASPVTFKWGSRPTVREGRRASTSPGNEDGSADRPCLDPYEDREASGSALRRISPSIQQPGPFPPSR